MRREDILIVGGGPAGSAAAIRLQTAGRRPLLIERTAAPADALCGGFLSWATIVRLGRLGVDPFTLGAHPVDRVRLVTPAQTAEARLPARAAGLSRWALDAALIARVERVERGVAARAAELGQVRLDDGGAIGCDALFLATGKHELRGLARPRDAAGGDPAVGLRLRVPAAADLSGVIELHPFDRGYAGIVVQEDGRANICMAVRRSRLAEAGGVAALLDALAGESPRLGDRLAGRTDEVQAVAHVPYGWRARRDVAGLYRLGDQAGVIPSLAGEGIDIALASGIAAADALAGGGNYQAPFARRLRRPLVLAGWLRDMAERPAGAAAMARMLAMAPGLAGLLARLTRV